MAKRSMRYVLAGLVVVICILALTVFFQHRKIQHDTFFSLVDAKVELVLDKLDFHLIEKKIGRQGFLPPLQVAEMSGEISPTCSLDSFLIQIKEGFLSSGIQILGWQERNLKNTFSIHLELGQKSTLTHRLRFSLRKVKVALLIDDFGYINEGAMVDAFFKELPVPFTVSIIPGSQFAQEIAEKANQTNKQVLVHLPMQPKGPFNNQYQWIILERMSGDEIKETVREAVESIPHAQGLNNHMGSLVTTKKELMEPVLHVLKEKGMFLVDSRTSSSSIAYSLAQNLGVKSTYNCVFLDNKKERGYITNQFNRLISQATERGWALGLGHSHITTASTLRELIKTCDNRKIRFVLVSEIIH